MLRGSAGSLPERGKFVLKCMYWRNNGVLPGLLQFRSSTGSSRCCCTCSLPCQTLQTTRSTRQTGCMSLWTDINASLFKKLPFHVIDSLGREPMTIIIGLYVGFSISDLSDIPWYLEWCTSMIGKYYFQHWCNYSAVSIKVFKQLLWFIWCGNTLLETMLSPTTPIVARRFLSCRFNWFG